MRTLLTLTSTISPPNARRTCCGDFRLPPGGFLFRSTLLFFGQAGASSLPVPVANQFRHCGHKSRGNLRKILAVQARQMPSSAENSITRSSPSSSIRGAAASLRSAFFFFFFSNSALICSATSQPELVRCRHFRHSCFVGSHRAAACTHGLVGTGTCRNCRRKLSGLLFASAVGAPAGFRSAGAGVQSAFSSAMRATKSLKGAVAASPSVSQTNFDLKAGVGGFFEAGFRLSQRMKEPHQISL